MNSTSIAILVPLLSLLSEYLRFLVEWPIGQSFSSLYEVGEMNDLPKTAPVLPAHCIEMIPSLLADPIALLIKYTLLAPLRMDIGSELISHLNSTKILIVAFISIFPVYFTCIVKVMYNLLYFQVIVKLCSSLTEAECDHIIENYSTNESFGFNGFSSSSSAMAFVLKITDKCRLLRSTTTFAAAAPFASPSTSASTSASSQQPLNLNLLEQQLQKLCLPFLRIATLLRHHLYEQNLPEINDTQMEFVCLVYFLELVTIDIKWNNFDAAKALCFVPGQERKLPETWCMQLINLQNTEQDDQKNAIVSLINNQHALWQQPRLLRLPREYEKLFTVSKDKWCLFFI